MEVEDVYRLQRQLHSCHSQNKLLLEENSKLQAEKDGLRQRVAELEQIVNNQPINLIRQQVDPLAVSNSLAQLEDRLAAQAFEMGYLKRMMEDKSMMLAQAQRLKSQLEVSLQEKDLQLSLLSHQLKQGALRQDKFKKEVEMWRTKLEKANQERLKVLNEKEDLSKRLKREQNKNHLDLSQLGKDILSIKQSAAKQHSKANPSINTVFESILSVQQNELHDRNREIGKLKSINGSYGENNEVEHLKNTIKHLRGEITRYSSIVQVVTEKLAIAETAVQRYSESAQKCLEERTAFAELSERLEKLQAVKGLEDSLLKVTEELEAEKRSRIELKKNFVEVLYENQSLHEFLNQTFGDNYEQLLKKQIDYYRDRFIARFNNSRWALIEQLVSVNEKLRKKLRLQQ